MKEKKKRYIPKRGEEFFSISIFKGRLFVYREIWQPGYCLPDLGIYKTFKQAETIRKILRKKYM